VPSFATIVNVPLALTANDNSLSAVVDYPGTELFTINRHRSHALAMFLRVVVASSARR